MKFGAVPTAQGEGAILAHSLALPDQRLRKGTTLGVAEVEAIAAAGIAEITVARLEPDDVAEDAAAARLGHALAPDPAGLGLTRSAPFTGRLNLYAAEPGLAVVDAGLVARLNGLHEALTLATVAEATWVEARQMVATVKIIPYAAPEGAVREAEALLTGASPTIRVAPAIHRTAGLILTVTPGMKDSVVDKGAAAVRARLAALGLTCAAERRVPHETAALAAALSACPGDIVLILTGSATSDRADVGPAALIAGGGRLERFGMPVDPGNLLFLGTLADRPVIGLPGCARSPKLNGADWVLERVVAGQPPDAAAIGAMGVGGLLNEIPARPQPRAAPRESAPAVAAASAARRPRIGGILLAAGSSRRMAGRDKLLEDVDGVPMIAAAARALAESAVEETLVILRPDDAARRAALTASGVPHRVVENPRAAEGMGTSIGCAIRALGAGIDGALISLADMPEVMAPDYDRLIAAFDPGEGREIVRALADDGRPGHPVLFGQRFFEPLALLGGDEGARRVLSEHRDFVTEVRLEGHRAVTDLDTPEAWQAWRASRATGTPQGRN
ncbi:MAG: molybdopterin-binding/glycosyltransferase family 2 protein [Pseudomonadota bacterium]